MWLYNILTHKIVLLAVGGALGTVARYGVGRWFANQPWAHGLPWGTFAINVSGSFVLAVAAVVIFERLPPEFEPWYLLVGTGFCGGYTTFSTFQWETFELVRDGDWLLALANVGGSVVFGFLGILLAVGLVHVLSPQH
jgi:fluoride exporter